MDPCLPMDLVDEHTVDDTKFKVTGTGEYKRCEALLLSFVKNIGIYNIRTLTPIRRWKFPGLLKKKRKFYPLE